MNNFIINKNVVIKFSISKIMANTIYSCSCCVKKNNISVFNGDRN